MGIRFVSQKELDPESQRVALSEEAIKQYQELWADNDLLVVLVDASGSIDFWRDRIYTFLRAAVQEAASSDKRLAIYGFNVGETDGEMATNILEYKALDSPTLLRSADIGEGDGHLRLLEALDYIGTNFDPASGGTLLVCADGRVGDPYAAKDGIDDLRRAGLRVISLSPVGYEFSPQQEKATNASLVGLFGADNILVLGDEGLIRPGRPALQDPLDVQPGVDTETPQELGGDMTRQIRVYHDRPEYPVYSVFVEQDGEEHRFVILADGLTIPSTVPWGSHYDALRRVTDVDSEDDRVGEEGLPEAIRKAIDHLRTRPDVFAAYHQEEPEQGI